MNEQQVEDAAGPAPRSSISGIGRRIPVLRNDECVNNDIAVAVVGGTDAGLVVGLPHWNQPDLAAIVSMWVAPKYRQAGVGTALIQEAIAWAKESGYAAAQLEVADGNISATQLYERMAFVPTGNVSTLPPPRDHITEHELILRFL
jgi:GNAT superfamily N-acetyltransferase